MPAAVTVMNQHAKVGLLVLGFVALGILLAVESSRTSHQQFDPRFILIVIVIGVIWLVAKPKLTYEFQKTSPRRPPCQAFASLPGSYSRVCALDPRSLSSLAMALSLSAFRSAYL